VPVPVPPGASLNRVPGIAHTMHCPNDPIGLGFVRDPVRRVGVTLRHIEGMPHLDMGRAVGGISEP